MASLYDSEIEILSRNQCFQANKLTIPQLETRNQDKIKIMKFFNTFSLIQLTSIGVVISNNCPTELDMLRTAGLRESSLQSDIDFVQPTLQDPPLDPEIIRRQTLIAELIDLADSLLENFEKYQLVMRDSSLDYEARQTWEGDAPVSVIKYKAKGFTEQHWLDWVADPVTVQKKLNHRLSGQEISQSHPQFPSFHLQMKLPPLFANRSIITTFYKTVLEDGSHILINSSQGNEALTLANHDLIGKNVVAKANITFTKGTFHEWGCEIVQVISVNIRGSIPNFAQAIMTQFMADTTKNLVDYLVYGVIPKQLF